MPICANRLVPLLVPYIVPAAGLKWLWSNPALLACWLGAMSGDARSAGLLGEIIELSSNAPDNLESHLVARSSVVPHQTVAPTEPIRTPMPTETPDDAGVAEAVQTQSNDQPAAVRMPNWPMNRTIPGDSFYPGSEKE